MHILGAFYNSATVRNGNLLYTHDAIDVIITVIRITTAVDFIIILKCISYVDFQRLSKFLIL